MNSHRLPRTVVPSRYDIRLEPDLESATYAGEEIVQVEVRDETDDVQLNAVELTITSVVAEGEEGTRLEGTASLDPATEDRVHLRFPRALRPGDHFRRPVSECFGTTCPAPNTPMTRNTRMEWGLLTALR